MNRSLGSISIAGALLAVATIASHLNAAGPANLVTLASARFSKLTRAEIAMLNFSQAGNVSRGEYAFGGESDDPNDPSNDPKNSRNWGVERSVRAQIITWLCDDSAAVSQVSGRGIRVLGVRIVDRLDLSYLKVSFPIIIRNSVVASRISLVGSDLKHLDLSGSYVTETDAKGLVVHGDFDLADGFVASGETRLENVRIEGEMNCARGSFHYSSRSMSQYSGVLRPALILDESTFGADLALDFGFRADGAVLIRDSSVANDLDMFGAQISNRNSSALKATLSNFETVLLGAGEGSSVAWKNFDADGRVDFTAATIRALFVVSNAKFRGAATEEHGFYASGLRSHGLLWQNVELQNRAVLDLRNAQVDVLLDDERSWPHPGELLLDGFTYGNFGIGTPDDSSMRLKWLGLQPQGYYPQPYRQLAKVLLERGDDTGATNVMVASGDARYAQLGVGGRIVGRVLKYTIGYGHRPLLAIVWSSAVVLLGWFVVAAAKKARIMRLTWPETTPIPAGDPAAGLYPLLYSLDVFLPFVNLHQEHYWWPDSTQAGEWKIGTVRLRVRGSIVLYYLWLQIISGWLLSAIFVAGVTGLIRNE